MPYSRSLSLNIRPGKSAIRALKEELELSPRPRFVLQLSRSGLRIVAVRRFRRRWSGGPLLVIAADANSLNGFSIMASASRVPVGTGPAIRPPLGPDDRAS
ncbi:MAG: hypothetical protein DRK00_00035 [Thermoprotei archaeon]|nr:MAG: hypothetical protein DRK00_00035 [Thermoprotei archaeon]